MVISEKLGVDFYLKFFEMEGGKDLIVVINTNNIKNNSIKNGIYKCIWKDSGIFFSKVIY